MKIIAVMLLALLVSAAVPSAYAQGRLQAAPAAGQAKTYHFIEIAGLLAAAYALTYGLARKGNITLVTHRRIWNVFLLLSFVFVGSLGLLLVIRINYGLAPLQHFFVLFWHVEAGIAMAVISIFHVLWHWRYYACMMKRGGRKRCED
jgi:hypothetical protein